MTKEYKLSRGWKISTYVAASLTLALFVWLLVSPLLSGNEKDLSTLWFVGPISLAMIALMLFGLIEAIKGKFVIHPDRVVSVSTFSHDELMLDEIKGYRITEKYIFIEANTASKKTIKISTYFGKINEILLWLAERYPDLDEVQVEVDKKEIMNNALFGQSEEQREEKLAGARKVADALNWTGSVISMWTLFFPTPYAYAILAASSFPLLCALITNYYRGLIRLNEKRDTVYPSATWAILAPGLSLFIRGFIDYNIFDYSPIWWPAILLTTSIMALLTLRNTEFPLNKAKTYLSLSLISIFLFSYSFGAVVTLNCRFDPNKPKRLHAAISGKRFITGVSTSYYLQLSALEQQKEAEEFSVTEEMYNHLEVKDSVSIYFMKGRFGIPWYDIPEADHQ